MYVCVFVRECVCVCPPVQHLTTECLELRILILVHRYIFKISVKFVYEGHRVRVKVNFKFWAITFRYLELPTSFLAYRYIFKICRASSHFKVLGSKVKVKVNFKFVAITFECLEL